MYMSWSTKYKNSIDCDNPKGFSQKAHCAGREKNEDLVSNTKNKVINWLEKTKHFVKNNWEEFKSATDREKKETIVALHIFQRMIMGEEVSEAEKRFLKSQSKDVVKILFLVSFKFVPSPIPITPITIYLGNKVYYHHHIHLRQMKTLENGLVKVSGVVKVAEAGIDIIVKERE
jgi:hypothetical protein